MRGLWLVGVLMGLAGELPAQDREPEEVRALLADSVEVWAHRLDSLAQRPDATIGQFQRLAGRLVEQLRQHQLAIDQLVKLEENQCDYWLFNAGCPTVVIGPGVGYVPDADVQVRIAQLTVGIPLHIPWLSGHRRVQMDSVRSSPAGPVPSR